MELDEWYADVRLITRMPSVSGGSGQRIKCKAVRLCSFGYEYGYYVILKDDSRVFSRVGVARTYDSAVIRLGRL